MEEKAREAER